MNCLCAMTGFRKIFMQLKYKWGLKWLLESPSDSPHSWPFMMSSDTKQVFPSLQIPKVQTLRHFQPITHTRMYNCLRSHFPQPPSFFKKNWKTYLSTKCKYSWHFFLYFYMVMNFLQYIKIGVLLNVSIHFPTKYSQFLRTWWIRLLGTESSLLRVTWSEEQQLSCQDYF